MLWFLDQFGRGESLLHVYAYLPAFLRFISKPWFPGAVLAAGFSLLWMQGKNFEPPTPKTVLIHPTTFQPIRLPSRIKPALKRSIWASACAVFLALLIWSACKTSLRGFIWIQALPGADRALAPVALFETETILQTNRAPQIKNGHAKISQRGVPVVSAPVQTQIASPTTLGAPSGIIPNDPAQAIEAINGMRNMVSEVLQKRETITFLMSWSDDDPKYLASISSIFSSACRTEPRQCWFTQPGNQRNLDLPKVRGSTRQGLTIHGKGAQDLANVLGRWFVTFSSSSIPAELSAYRAPETKEMIWVEIGPGSPWKTAP